VNEEGRVRDGWRAVTYPLFDCESAQAGLEYDPKRLPAYTDRVLWRSAVGLDGAVEPPWCVCRPRYPWPPAIRLYSCAI
jgi:hypothetical protein